LIWRDYFKYISLKNGDTIFKIGGILDRDYDWKNNQLAIKGWINGTTKDM
jgi:deoxyribodipyrimidine photo-lyase